MAKDYWVDRMTREREALTNKTINDTEKQLKKYYQSAMKKIINDFEAVYDKLLTRVAEDKEVTPADLYLLNKYWEMQNQLANELQKLGDKQAKLLSKQFMEEYKQVYKMALKGDIAFSEANLEMAEQLINSIWVNDGKSWSTRIWENNGRLRETLNEELIHCVVSGKKTTELKHLLQERFGVAYHRADTLCRTEIAHIETVAAKQRYKDYGLKYYEFFADPDERTCGVCKSLDGKRFLLTQMKPGVNAPPMHPNDRCTIIPVIE